MAFKTTFSEEELGARFKGIIESAVDGIITINTDGIIDTINPSACKIFGYKEDELLGKRIETLMPAHDAHHHHQYVSQYISTGKKKIIGIGREVKGLKKDGTQFPFWLSISEVRIGSKIIFTGVIHDITELKKAEEVVVQLNDQLLKSNKDLEIKVGERTDLLAKAISDLITTNNSLSREIHERLLVEEQLRIKSASLEDALQTEKELHELKSKFISIASHEFRTPLSTMLSSVGLINRYIELGNTEKQEFHLQKIKHGIQHLTGILHDLLSLSKIDENKVQIDYQDINIEKFMYEEIDQLSTLLGDNRTITVSETGKTLHIQSDKNALHIILNNILGNAIKYSEDNIEVLISEGKEHIKIDIQDKGIGIPKDELQFMFSRFYRAKNATHITGTGLGLSIVKSYVELIGGEIAIDSVERQGTTIHLTFPKHHT